MLFHEERRPKNLFMREILQFMLDYEIYSRFGISFKDLMDMERSYYLEWRKFITDAINEERATENKRNEELAAKREQERAMAELERAKMENARRKPLTAKQRK